MKCIMHTETGVIDRVRDHVADARVKRGTWAFVKKEVWKEHLKDEMEARAKEVEAKKNNKKSKKKGKKNESND